MNTLVKMECFETMRPLLVKYYIDEIFIKKLGENNEKEIIDTQFDYKILENENNKYAYFEDDTFKRGLLILDVENNIMYNFIGGV